MSSAPASVRLWVLAVALGSFATGMVVGFAVPEMLAADHAQASKPEDYANDLDERYSLSADQRRSAVMVFEQDQRRELEILKDADWSQLPQSLRNERLAAKRKTEQRIRFVLDEEQRALYDRDSRPNSPGAFRSTGKPENR